MFKEFKICEIFEKINTPKIKYKAKYFSEEWSKEYSIPLLTAGIDNQGFARFAKPSDCPMIIKNCISVSANGANSGVAFYQPVNFAVLQDAYALKIINREIQCVEEGLYLTCALNKAIKDNHDWSNKAGWNRIKNDKISLPVDKNENIDWNFMHDYIEKLIHERIEKLKTYLKSIDL